VLRAKPGEPITFSGCFTRYYAANAISGDAVAHSVQGEVDGKAFSDY